MHAIDPKENAKLTLANAIAQAPNARAAAAIKDAATSNLGSRLSPNEREALANFAKGARAGVSVQQQEAKHGGRAAIERKERAFSGVRSQNQHEQGGK